MRVRGFFKWALVALLVVQTACGGGLLAGVGPVRGLFSGASSRFNLFSPEQDVELGTRVVIVIIQRAPIAVASRAVEFDL